MSARRDERTVDDETVRREHLGQVHVLGHWAYLVAVLLGGTILMLGLIALMGSGS